MKGYYIIAGALCFLLAGLVGSDYLATSISTDGTAILATSGENTNGSFASRVMTLDPAQLSRTVTANEDLFQELTVQGKGPVLFAEYGSDRTQPLRTDERCSFLQQYMDQGLGEASRYLSGILGSGTYASSQRIGDGLDGMSDVNGTGMVVLGSEILGNRSLLSHGFVSGNFSARDIFRYGGRL